MDVPELKPTEAFYSLRKVAKELQVQLFDCMLMKISLKPAKTEAIQSDVRTTT